MQSDESIAVAEYSYLVDREYRVCATDSAFKEFARDNGAPELASVELLGKSLFDYVCNPETIQIYKLVIDKVLESQSAVSFPLRCDSPGEKNPRCQRFPTASASHAGTTCLKR